MSTKNKHVSKKEGCAWTIRTLHQLSGRWAEKNPERNDLSLLFSYSAKKCAL
jgi:hypothetical protein